MINKEQAKPVGDRILIKELPPEIREGKLFIPDGVQTRYWEVVAIGTGFHLQDGTKVYPPFVVGDKVVIANGAGVEVKIPESFRVVNSSEVLVRLSMASINVQHFNALPKKFRADFYDKHKSELDAWFRDYNTFEVDKAAKAAKAKGEV